MGKFLDLLNSKLRITRQSTYLRPEYNSFMSGPEWRNVEIAEEFAQFLKDGHSMFHYPYFSQIADIWRVFYKSWQAAREYDAASSILTSEYMVMDVFVSFSTTMELLPKGLLSLVLKQFVSASNKTDMQAHLAADLEQYAKELQTVPFYDQQYAARRTRLQAAYADAKEKTWGDWFSWTLLSADLWLRHWASKPLHNWFHTDDNIVPATTDILVEMTGEEGNAEQAAAIFRQKLAGLQEQVQIVTDEEKQDLIFVDAPESEEATSENIIKDASHTHVYGLLRAHRYAEFQNDIKALDKAGLHVVKIAGQDQVQVKCEIELKSDDATALQAKQQVLSAVPHAEFRYAYEDRIHRNRQICLFDVPVVHLQQTVAAFNKLDDVKVSYIHNF